jgi:HEAT repeat protein
VKAEGTSSQSATEGTSADIAHKRSETIRFGIESELLELSKTLATEKESRFNKELLDLFGGSRSPRLRVAILGLFKQLEWADAESAALEIVKGRDGEDPTSVAAALEYLGQIRSKQALEYAPAIIEENNKTLLPPLVTLMGRSGGEREEAILLGWLKGDAPSQILREASIRALGDIGSSAAAESLMKILGDDAAQRFERIYAAEALSKIGYGPALASLIKAANGEDPNIRAAAVEALASFKGGEVDSALVEALRDPFVKSRIAACKALGKRRLESALPILQYKATNDPEKSVKAEALRAIAEIGVSGSFSFLEGLMADKKTDAPTRILIFGVLARKNASASMDRLLVLLSEESRAQDRGFFTGLAREAAGAADAADIAPLIRVLLVDKDYLIRLGGLEWAKATKSNAIKSDVEGLSTGDPSEFVRKRAGEILALW